MNNVIQMYESNRYGVDREVLLAVIQRVAKKKVGTREHVECIIVERIKKTRYGDVVNVTNTRNGCSVATSLELDSILDAVGSTCPENEMTLDVECLVERKRNAHKRYDRNEHNRNVKRLCDL
jgi:hypothetical protein